MQKRSLHGLRRRLLKHAMTKKMNEEQLLIEYIERIKRNYPRSTIILFGSRAKGRQLPYSDYDIAVVLENIDDKLEMTIKLRRLKPHGLDLDLVVLDKRELEDPMIKAMLGEKRILYDGLSIRF